MLLKRKGKKATEREKKITNHILIKGLAARTYQKPSQVTNKKANDLIKFKNGQNI